jgi:hypothetical protein
MAKKFTFDLEQIMTHFPLSIVYLMFLTNSLDFVSSKAYIMLNSFHPSNSTFAQIRANMNIDVKIKIFICNQIDIVDRLHGVVTLCNSQRQFTSLTTSQPYLLRACRCLKQLREYQRAHSCALTCVCWLMPAASLVEWLLW